MLVMENVTNKYDSDLPTFYSLKWW